MLAKLCANDFKSLKNKIFQLSNAEKKMADLKLVSIKENPAAASTDQPERVPFSLLFKAEDNENFESGSYRLECQGIEKIDNLYISRVLNPGAKEPGPYYQIIFN